MLKHFIIAAALVAAASSPVALASEDAIVADPQRYTLEFENDRVRIIRIRYGAGEKSVMHTHGPNVSVMLSKANIRMHLPDGGSADMSVNPGEAWWTDAEEHMPENLGDGPLEVVLVELKD